MKRGISAVVLCSIAASSSSSALRLRSLPSYAIVKPSVSSTRLYSLALGSDLIERPDDENSPEYKEYLKALLTLQANRAKTGHSAASSGSADAYISKLNRIKIERNMLRDAGLSEEEVDVSYSQLDYDSALMESQEPTVSTGGDGSGKKVRGLSKEEAELRAVIEARVMRRVQQSVEDSGGGGRFETGTKPKRDPSVLAKIRLGENESKLIDNLVGQITSTPTSPISSSEPPMTPTAPISLSEPPMTPTAPIASFVHSVPADRKALFKAAMSDSTPAPVASSPPPAPAVPPPSLPSRKLPVADLDLAATALQLLVRHRGGGPFGSGRLGGADADALVGAIEKAAHMLRRDAETPRDSDANDTPAPVISAPPVSKAPVISAPPVSKAPVVSAPPVSEAPVISAPPVSKAPVVSAPPVSKAPVISAPPGPRVVTIAQGLDSFLASPSSVDLADLAGLRDGIIACLGIIQNEIISRTASQPAPAAPTSATSSAPRLAPSLSEGESLDQQLRTTTGLLLKHRGGPSFGHGRLEGAELDNLETRLIAIANTLAQEAAAGGGGKKILKIGDE